MFRTLFCVSLLAITTACGNGGGGSTPGTETNAEISLALTDAATDELATFEVDVRNVTFTKVNGNTFEVLPRTVRVDFLELESLAELVAARTLEPGSYERITLDLDFTDSRIVIAGQTTPATVLDSSGNPITGVVPIVIEFPTGPRPLVRGDRHNLWVLDLNVDQSVAVDALANTVTFTPVFTVEIDPANPKTLAMRGVLQSIDPNARTFVLERRAPDDTVIGQFTVLTGDATVFHLDGVAWTGAPGLGALAGHIGGRVYVQGTINGNNRVLRASLVEAGAGVPGNGQDWVLGHVVGRTGGAGANATLSVAGRSFDVATSTRQYDTVHTVNVSFANTKVLRRGTDTTVNTDAINVGQLVWVFGDLTGTTLDATTTTGVVRLLPTHIFGIANGAVAQNTLSLDVTRFGLLPVTDFSFDVDGATQANPDAYTFDVGGLSTQGITTGSKLRVLAWIRGVGASGADAEALAIENRSLEGRVLFCQWSPPAANVLSASQAASLTIDVSAATKRVVHDGIDALELLTSPAPRVDGLGPSGFYVIVKDGHIECETTFSAFRNRVLVRAATTPVFRVSAVGSFDQADQFFRARLMTVVLD